MEPLKRAGFDRRSFLKTAGAAGLSAFLPWRSLLAGEPGGDKDSPYAHSVIVLWMAGGPSQLETFDPHPGKAIAGGTAAIPTRAKGIQLARGFDALSEQMDKVSLIRSLVSKEGDHERGTYYVKTGYRPEPTVRHPSLGAIVCQQLEDTKVEIPRHVSIFPNQWPGWGGYLGSRYDTFKTYDPSRNLPDVSSSIKTERYKRRLEGLDVIEGAFARGREKRVQATRHRGVVKEARTMMLSEQLEAFDIKKEPEDLRKSYGESAFGRGCLVARRLVEVGVRWIEVGLGGWDTHVNNHESVANQVKILDPAFAALVKDLADRDMLRKTIVVCMGEFGRTPKINPLGGRDHWPSNFSVALAGGPIRGGQVIGESDPEGGREVKDPQTVSDLSATLLKATGVNPGLEVITPIQRPILLSDGKPIKKLLSLG